MLFKNIELNIEQILINKPKIILGLSGGPDSIFLFYFLKQLHNNKKIELICTHLDHGWREKSGLDEEFCANLCNEYKIKYYGEHSKNILSNLKLNGSKEDLGRKLRRKLFESVLKKEKAQFIALAHHLQDQQETFFWRIIRGTTLSGLTGIKKIDPPYIRPLLNTSKPEILEYLDTNKIKYLHDPTNTSEEFLRNRIRKHVLPAMQKCDKRFDQKFESTIKHLQAEEAFLQKLTQINFDIVFISPKTNETTNTTSTWNTGSLEKLLNLDPVLQRRIIIFWIIKEKVTFNLSEKFLNEIFKFLKHSQGGCHQLSQSWKVCKKKKLFWIEKFA